VRREQIASGAASVGRSTNVRPNRRAGREGGFGGPRPPSFGGPRTFDPSGAPAPPRNRNFGPDWRPNDCNVNRRYCAGAAAEDQPESQAITAFLKDIKPMMTAWYHGPLHVIDRALSYGVANPAVLDAYAAQVGYAVATVNCSPTGICVGNATQWGNYNLPGSSAFVIELQTGVAGALTAQGVQNHVNAFFAAAAVA